MNYCVDLNLGKAFYIFIFFHFPYSRLSVLKGFHFYFCFLRKWKPRIRKIIDIALHRRSGPLKTICCCGLWEVRLPLIDRKFVFSNPSSARHKNRSPRIQVSDSCYERWFGGIEKNVGQYVVELEIILWRLCFVFLPFFLNCPCSLLNKYYHFVHGFFLGLISEE